MARVSVPPVGIEPLKSSLNEEEEVQAVRMIWWLERLEI